MNFRRLTNPEISTPTETGPTERVLRKIGGYTLGLFGYGFGALSVTGVATTGGLSLPVLGGISGALFAGSRALLRPAYQDDDDYETVRNEDLSDKAKRIGAFAGGIALLNIGGNLLTGGLFNAIEGMSMGAPSRIISTVVGFVAAGYGARFVRGSFDPELHNTRSSTDTPRSLTQTAKVSFLDGWRRSKEDRGAMREFYDRQNAKQHLLGEEFKQKMTDLFSEYASKLRTGEATADDHKAAVNALLTDYKQRSRTIADEQFTPTPALA